MLVPVTCQFYLVLSRSEVTQGRRHAAVLDGNSLVFFFLCVCNILSNFPAYCVLRDRNKTAKLYLLNAQMHSSIHFIVLFL